MGFFDIFSRKKKDPAPDVYSAMNPLARELQDTTTRALTTAINTPAPQFPGKLDSRYNAQIPDLLKQTEGVLSGRLANPTVNPDELVRSKVYGDYFNALNSELEREFERELATQKEVLAGANLLTSGPGFQQINDLTRDQSQRSKNLKSAVEKEALDRYLQATELRENTIGRDIDQSTNLGNLFLQSDETALDRALQDFTRQQEQDLRELGLSGDYLSSVLNPQTFADLGIKTKQFFSQDQVGDLLGNLLGDWLGGNPMDDVSTGFEWLTSAFGGGNGGSSDEAGNGSSSSSSSGGNGASIDVNGFGDQYLSQAQWANQLSKLGQESSNSGFDFGDVSNLLADSGEGGGNPLGGSDYSKYMNGDYWSGDWYKDPGFYMDVAKLIAMLA